MKVLFVDNDAVMRIMARQSIESRMECKVLLAANGTEAVRTALKEGPSLIVLDLIMPGLDGVQTLKKLREQGCKAPVIFVTAKDDVSELMQYQELGVASIIQKPFTPDILLVECRKALGTAV